MKTVFLKKILNKKIFLPLFYLRLPIFLYRSPIYREKPPLLKMFKFTSSNLFVFFRFISLGIVLSIAVESKCKAQISGLPVGFSDNLFAGNFNQIEGFVQDSLGRYFCWERAGTVVILDSIGNKLPTLIDIKEEVGSWGDHGLNAVVLDPNFTQNGYIYLYYGVDRHYLLNFGTSNYNPNTNQFYEASIARVTRYTCDVNTNFTTIVPNSRLILLGTNKQNGIPIVASNHGGGGMVFGADGSLIIASGDGSVNGGDFGSTVGSYWQQALSDSIIKPYENIGCNKSQLIQSLNGKLLRINPSNGSGYITNPFYEASNPSSPASLVWALGLRNPFRISLKKGTGSSDITAGNPGLIMIGDVGGTKYEELDICNSPGQNFGWPLYEGFSVNPDFYGKNHYNVFAPNPLFGINGCSQQYFTFTQLLNQPLLTGNPFFANPCSPSDSIPVKFTFIHQRPLIDYKHAGSITRTANFTNNIATEISVTDINAPITGNVFNGSCVIGGEWYDSNKFPLQFQKSYFFSDYTDKWIKAIKYENNLPVSIQNFANNAGSVVYIEPAKNGCLMYINYTSELRKICYDSIVNNPPVAKITINKNFGASPLMVNFSGVLSTDPDNDSLTYFWNFNDSSTATGVNANKTFTGLNVAKFWVKLYVTDPSNNTTVDSVLISLNNTPPTVNITSIAPQQGYSVVTSTLLNLAATVTDLEHNLSQLHYKWETILVHNQHEHPNLPDTDYVTSTTLLPLGCDGETYFYIIRLTVTDDGGLKTVAEKQLQPICGKPYVDFTSASKTICRYSTTTFSDLSTNGISSREWTFTGGTPATSTLANPIVTYNSTGNFSVKLKVCNVNGCDSITKNAFIAVKGIPSANVSAGGPVNFCEFGSVNLTATTGSGGTFQWFQNNVLMPGKTGNTLVADTTGNYKVRVTTSFGCSNFSNVVKTKIVPEFSITVTGSLNLCNGSSVTLTATSNPDYTYKWKKSGVNISGQVNNEFTTTTPGAYTVRVADNITGCTKLSSNYNTTINCNKDADSLQEESPLSALNYYPNPVYDLLNLNLDIVKSSQLSFRIFDIYGRKVFEKNDENFTVGAQEIQINFSTFTSGIYEVQILSNNKQIKSLRVIKE